jgi:hypothetical protein
VNTSMPRRCIVMVALALASSTSVFAQLNTAQSILTLDAPGNDRHYKIIEPNVLQRSTEYPSIAFKSGDVVRFRAGGCVQTGGAGKTWKRYVRPSGPNSDRLYHGMVWIPGVMSNLQFLSTHLDGLEASSSWSRDFVVPSDMPAPNAFLILGYTDDDYHDNGYWGKDPGTENQCEGVDNAWFEIYIKRN